MAEDPRTETEGRSRRSKPRLGLVIRVLIYVPLLGFFGWRAWERYASEREAADEVFRERVGQWLANPPQTIMLPNGEALPMLTPEQAEAHGYKIPDSVLHGDGEHGETGEAESPAASPAPNPAPNPTPSEPSPAGEAQPGAASPEPGSPEPEPEP